MSGVGERLDLGVERGEREIGMISRAGIEN